MKIINKLIILLSILIFVFTSSCQGIKDNLTLKKKANTDEFLVEKKNPLVLPPDYDKLPKPSSEDDRADIDEEGNTKIDFSKIFKKQSQNNSNNSSTINKSLEDSIRKKIGNN